MATAAQAHAHREAVAVAKSALQASLAGNPTEATKKAAYITYEKAVLASARINGHMTGALAALHALGVDDGGQVGDT